MRSPLLQRAWVVPALLALVVFVSVTARSLLLGEPCQSPCTKATDHVLVFDEAYYVNAARVIAGERPPPQATYSTAPLGDDPNSEHPQLVKAIIAGSIELFGDGPLAWRLGSIVFGTLAILGLYVLVRAAGGGAWLALGAAALMASDNLLLVHGRIGTLDIYAAAAMVWGAAFYLRRQPILAGVAIGIGACAKEVTPYVLLVLALVEAMRLLARRTPPLLALRRLAICALAAAVVFVALLALLDRVAPPYDPVAGKLVGGGVFGHIGHILSYAKHQTSPHGPRGIASYPWQWLADYKVITYLNINPSLPSTGLYNVYPRADFLGMISPPILALTVPGLLVAAWMLVRRRRGTAGDVERLALAWFLGTWLPFELLSLFLSRTSYLYYMVIVMPGIYIAVAALVGAVVARTRRLWWLAVLWAASVLAAAIVMYPFIAVF